MELCAISHDSHAADSRTILIIDDDAINRMILRKIFVGSYAVKEAENGRQGLAELLNPDNQFCAVLLDVMMPEMSGLEVLQHLKALGFLDRIPVFLITAETQEKVVREAYQLGVMDVIKKPVISYIVLRRVASIVELFEARKYMSKVIKNQQEELLEQANRIIDLNQGMIEALATAIEFRNEESGGHVQRISGITRLVLENTEFGEGLNENEINNISLAYDTGRHPD